MARKRKAADLPALASANPSQHIPSGPLHVDIAVMLPGFRQRHDGWNQQRLQRFLDVLAYCGCVEDAARVAGMSDTGARRLKKKFPLFAAAWDQALARAQQGLIAIAYQRAVEGRETVIIRKGEEYERRIQPSDAILGLLIKRGDMAGGNGAYHPDEVLTVQEYLDGWAFGQYGNKYKLTPDDEVHASLMKKLEVLRWRMDKAADKRGICRHCGTPLAPGVTNSMLGREDMLGE